MYIHILNALQGTNGEGGFLTTCYPKTPDAATENGDSFSTLSLWGGHVEETLVKK